MINDIKVKMAEEEEADIDHAAIRSEAAESDSIERICNRDDEYLEAEEDAAKVRKTENVFSL